MNLTSNIEDWSALEKSEALKVILGSKLGQGQARAVFAMAHNPDLVVKIEGNSQSFQNIREWEIWKDAQDFGKWSRWFAPCVDISPCGLVLIQKRAKPLAPGFLPAKLPSFMCDLKPGNFGMIGKQIVAIDYGFHHFYRHGLRRARMKATPARDWATEKEQ